MLRLKCTACGSELRLEVAFTGCDWETEAGKGSGYNWPISLKCPNPDCAIIYTIGHVKNYGDFVGMADEYKCVK